MEIKCSQNFLKRGQRDVVKYKNLTFRSFFFKESFTQFYFLHVNIELPAAAD